MGEAPTIGTKSSLLINTCSNVGNAKFVDYLVKGMEQYLQKFPIMMLPPKSKAETSQAATRRSVGAAAGAGGIDYYDDCTKYALADFPEENGGEA